jgi:hypothetical protein
MNETLNQIPTTNFKAEADAMLASGEIDIFEHQKLVGHVQVPAHIHEAYNAQPKQIQVNPKLLESGRHL